MRSFIRVSAAVVALLVATNVAGAQGGGAGGGGGMRGGGGRAQTGESVSGRYLTDITLDDAQKGKLADVVKWYDVEAVKLPAMPQRGADGTPPDSAAGATARAARATLNTTFQGKIKAFLTPEQVTKFDANLAAAAARGGRGRGGE
jgi:Spy/CpxP family protein refolding chaperone